MFRLKLLGRFRLLRLDGTPVDVKGLRDRALLVFLCLQNGLQPRERVTGLLWEDRPEAQARQSLRQSLAALRRAGLPVIAHGKDMLALGSDLDCDVTGFLRAASGQSLDELRGAIAFYDGPLCEDWHGNLPAFEEWLRAERQRLADVATNLCLRLADWQAPKLPPSERLFLSRKALDIDPYLETAHRTELRALCEMGLRGEAVLRHRSFAGRLKQELGLLPEDETIAAAADAGAARPAREAAPPAARPVLRRRLCVFGLSRPAGRADTDYLCLGIMNEVAAALTRFRSFDVIPPGSMAGLAAESGDPLRAARERAQADFALDGLLSAEGAGVSIRLYLHNLATGMMVWNWDSGRETADYPALSRQIALSVAQRIDTRIEQEQVDGALPVSQAERQGYDLWLRAQHLLVKWTAASDDEAEAMLRDAVAIYPRLARAHSSLALLYNGRVLMRPGYTKDAEDRRIALHHARLALDCDSQDPRSHIAMMWVAIWMCDHARAARHAQLCHELNPFSADVLMHVALVRAGLGETAIACQLAAEAKALNPLFPDWYNYFHAVVLVLAGDHAGALAVGLPHAGEFLELSGWLAIAAAHDGQAGLASTMAHQLQQATRESWEGAGPWTPQEAEEWFYSVNRWLKGRERDIVEQGFALAGLRP